MKMFGLTEWPKLQLPCRITPNQQVPIVRHRTGSSSCEAVLVRWGIVSSRAKHFHSDKLLISTTADKITASHGWLDAFSSRRCLVLADDVNLWSGRDDTKLPWLICRRDGQPMALAGLWESGMIESCVLLTTGPNEATAPLSLKLPVILHPADHGRWLDPAIPEGDRLLRPCPVDWIEVCEI